jgi:hypothetical protein
MRCGSQPTLGSVSTRWREGETVVRREVLRGRPWAGIPVFVVRDDPGLLATYIAEGAELGFADGEWPGGRHPWHGKTAWRGHGVLTLQRPDDAYAVWAFWREPGRAFAGWYVNFQAPFRRTAIGYDTLDHEIDIWIPGGGPGWEWKDRELLETRVAEGRFTAEEAVAIRRDADRVAAELDAGRRWWDDGWRDWRPDPSWRPPGLPHGWETA